MTSQRKTTPSVVWACVSQREIFTVRMTKPGNYAKLIVTGGKEAARWCRGGQWGWISQQNNKLQTQENTASFSFPAALSCSHEVTGHFQSDGDVTEYIKTILMFTSDKTSDLLIYICVSGKNSAYTFFC